MTKSWRDFLPIHPAAKLFPLMPDYELRALGEDIKENGLREPEGPRPARDGDRTIITEEAKADWRRERKAETMRDAKKAEAKSVAASLPQTSANVTD